MMVITLGQSTEQEYVPSIGFSYQGDSVIGYGLICVLTLLILGCIYLTARILYENWLNKFLLVKKHGCFIMLHLIASVYCMVKMFMIKDRVIAWINQEPADAQVIVIGLCAVVFLLFLLYHLCMLWMVRALLFNKNSQTAPVASTQNPHRSSSNEIDAGTNGDTRRSRG